MKDNDERLKKHIDLILSTLLDRNESQQREFLRILFKMKLSENQEAILFDNCIEIWKSIHKKPGVRYAAFKILIKTAEKYPELLNEIFILTQPHYIDTLSKGAKHSINKILMKLHRFD